MEGYKSFKETVMDASSRAKLWGYVGDENAFFNKDDLLEMAELYDKQCPLDASSYFVCFPDGEICLLSTGDGLVEKLFTPVQEKKTGADEV